MITLTSEQFADMRELTLRAQPPEVMSVSELALYLGLSEDLVRAQTAEGKIPFKSVGRRILYYRETIRTWMARGAGARA